MANQNEEPRIPFDKLGKFYEVFKRTTTRHNIFRYESTSGNKYVTTFFYLRQSRSLYNCVTTQQIKINSYLILPRV